MLLSVFTPCYNSSATLERCYQSLLRQTYKNFEWILIDDNSTDNYKTQRLILELKKKAPFPIKYYFLEENYFGARSMYKACELAKGDYLLLLDHDDEYFPITLDRVSYYIKAFFSEEIVALRAKCIDEFGKPIGKDYKVDTYITTEGFIRYRVGMMQELMLVGKTSILKEISAKIKSGFTYAFVAAQISQKYKSIYPNEALRIYHTTSPNSFTNNSSLNLKFPDAKVEQNFILWNSYAKYLIYKPIQTLKEFIHTNSLIYKYKIKYQKTPLTNNLLRFIFNLTYPLGMAKLLFYKFTKRQI